MGAITILAPVVIAAWPAFSAAVVAAATSLGYAMAKEMKHELADQHRQAKAINSVQLQVPHSEVVTDQLGRDQNITVTREKVTVTFSRDARGKATLCVTGEGHSQAALQAMGEQLSKRVVQRYVYQKIMDEMKTRQFLVVEEETDANQAIHLKVRHWES
jgi:hypothetical protein